MSWPLSRSTCNGSCGSASDDSAGVTESVAGGSGFDDGATVGETVDDGGAQAGVGEGFGPAGEGFVGGDRDGVLLFAFGEDLEEEFGVPLQTFWQAGYEGMIGA